MFIHHEFFFGENLQHAPCLPLEVLTLPGLRVDLELHGTVAPPGCHRRGDQDLVGRATLSGHPSLGAMFATRNKGIATRSKGHRY